MEAIYLEKLKNNRLSRVYYLYVVFKLTIMTVTWRYFFCRLHEIALLLDVVITAIGITWFGVYGNSTSSDQEIFAFILTASVSTVIQVWYRIWFICRNMQSTPPSRYDVSGPMMVEIGLLCFLLFTSGFTESFLIVKVWKLTILVLWPAYLLTDCCVGRNGNQSIQEGYAVIL
jgi:hypothetical protein